MCLKIFFVFLLFPGFSSLASISPLARLHLQNKFFNLFVAPYVNLPSSSVVRPFAFVGVRRYLRPTSTLPSFRLDFCKFAILYGFHYLKRNFINLIFSTPSSCLCLLKHWSPDAPRSCVSPNRSLPLCPFSCFCSTFAYGVLSVYISY